VNTPDEFDLEAGKMDAASEAFRENLLEAGAGGQPGVGEIASAEIDGSSQVQKAIEGFRAAEALLAEWEAKDPTQLRME